MVNKKGRPSRKESLFSQAIAIIANHGIASLTIESLATSQGVTKGGVQYHFASKDQLLVELLEWILSQFDEETRLAANKKRTPRAWLQAYVESLAGESSHGDRAVAGILALFEPEDQRAEPYRRYLQSWRQLALADDIAPDMALIIQLAAESLWMDRLYGDISPSQCRLVLRRLLKLIKESK